MKLNSEWPVIRQYDLEHTAHIDMPLGGIGTGTISLNGRGGLRSFEIYDRPAKDFTPGDCFTAIHVRQAGAEPITRAVEGPIPEELLEGPYGAKAPNHSLPRFRNAQFAAAYPLGQILFSDPEMPVDVRLEAFNPLIPADANESGLPVAILRYVVRNKTSRPAQVTLATTLSNFIGHNRTPKAEFINRNTFRKQDGLQGLFMESGYPDKHDRCWGTLALTTPTRGKTSYRTSWLRDFWARQRLNFWDDLSADGQLDHTIGEETPDPRGSLAVQQTIPARGEKTFTFFITWVMPNRYTWTPDDSDTETTFTLDKNSKKLPTHNAANNIGNYYATRFNDAWQAAAHVAKNLASLERRTVAFVGAIAHSDLPPAVKEAALFNISTLRTQTCFRSAAGTLYGWEGCGDTAGSCHGSCTHVWNYEHVTGFLFGELAWGMREMEFAHMTDDQGHMSFRIQLPLNRATAWGLAAADGQMGAIMRLYREWRLSGDDAALARLYPQARKTLEFCWIPGGWDADQDGVMEGCQHNTMDVEYYGPNPQMTGWYIGALHAMERLARHMNDTAFADRCRELYQKGSQWMDAHLFNGDYYEHHIVPVKSAADIAKGLQHASMGTRNYEKPEFQLGAGCLVDQLVGQYTAHVCGLGYLHDPAKVKKTLQSIMKYNWRETFFGHFNHLRSFVLNDESALLMCTYPLGRRPEFPFPYCNEVMTGFEYTAAIGMLYEGMTAQGLKAIAAIRARYDGRKRSPFDEAECGHHYARAMAAWAAVIACSGFQYSAAAGEMRFAAPQKGSVNYFWSTGYSWGTVKLHKKGRQIACELKVIEGTLALSRLIAGDGTVEFPRRALRAGQKITKNLS